MPIYEYRCQACKHLFEEWQKDFSERQASCPICASPADRLISNTSFILKGTGWYVTDYCNKNGGNGSSSGNGKNTGKVDTATDGAKVAADTASSPAKDSKPAGSSDASASKPASGSASSAS